MLVLRVLSTTLVIVALGGLIATPHSAAASVPVPAAVFAPIQRYVSALNHTDGGRACRQMTPKFLQQTKLIVAVFRWVATGIVRPPTCAGVSDMIGVEREASATFRSAQIVSSRLAASTATEAAVLLTLRVSTDDFAEPSILRERVYLRPVQGRWLIRKADRLFYDATGDPGDSDTADLPPLTRDDSLNSVMPGPATVPCAGSRIAAQTDPEHDVGFGELGLSDGVDIPYLDLTAASSYGDGPNACIAFRTASPPRPGTIFTVTVHRNFLPRRRYNDEWFDFGVVINHGGAIVGLDDRLVVDGSMSGFDGTDVVIRIAGAWPTARGKSGTIRVVSSTYAPFEPDLPNGVANLFRSDALAGS